MGTGPSEKGERQPFHNGTEYYVVYNLSKRQRSLCAQVRSGLLPLTVETGRYVNVEEEKWICPMCCLNDIENE